MEPANDIDYLHGLPPEVWLEIGECLVKDGAKASLANLSRADRAFCGLLTPLIYAELYPPAGNLRSFGATWRIIEASLEQRGGWRWVRTLHFSPYTTFRLDFGFLAKCTRLVDVSFGVSAEKTSDIVTMPTLPDSVKDMVLTLTEEQGCSIVIPEGWRLPARLETVNLGVKSWNGDDGTLFCTVLSHLENAAPCLRSASVDLVFQKQQQIFASLATSPLFCGIVRRFEISAESIICANEAVLQMASLEHLSVYSGDDDHTHEGYAFLGSDAFTSMIETASSTLRHLHFQGVSNLNEVFSILRALTAVKTFTPDMIIRFEDVYTEEVGDGYRGILSAWSSRHAGVNVICEFMMLVRIEDSDVVPGRYLQIMDREMDGTIMIGRAQDIAVFAAWLEAGLTLERDMPRNKAVHRFKGGEHERFIAACRVEEWD
jgi:hypothetical protein